VDRDGKIPPLGQIQANSLHIPGERIPIGVNQNGRQSLLPIGRAGQPVNAQLAPVKDFRLAVNTRNSLKGMEEEIIRPATREKDHEKNPGKPHDGRQTWFFHGWFLPLSFLSLWRMGMPSITAKISVRFTFCQRIFSSPSLPMRITRNEPC